MPKIPTKQESELQPFWRTKDDSVVYYHGDALDVARRLPSESVHMIITSPPYWGLRDYGTAQWEGGNSNCDHLRVGYDAPKDTKSTLKGRATNQNHEREPWPRGICGKCGAKRIDSQLGSEPSPDCGAQGKANCKACFVCNMVAVFKELYRVLRDDGTAWLNLGDSYASGSSGIESGNLLMVPHRVALALQANSWIVRQDIVWSKPSPMPESVTNRCTKAHEYIFLLAKSERYYYDHDAIQEPAIQPFGEPKLTAQHKRTALQDVRHSTLGTNQGSAVRNRRSVWTISSGEGYDGAHFATFPKKLVEPCVLAGTSEAGCCSRCGAPYRRVVEEEKLTRERPNDYVKRKGEEGTGNSCSNTVAGVRVKTIGWDAGCVCGAERVPCVVLDPFIGSGTSADVCVGLGRHCVGIDLSAEYLEKNAVPRVQGALLSRPALSHLIVERQKAKRFDGGQVLED